MVLSRLLLLPELLPALPLLPAAAATADQEAKAGLGPPAGTCGPPAPARPAASSASPAGLLLPPLEPPSLDPGPTQPCAADAQTATPGEGVNPPRSPSSAAGWVGVLKARLALEGEADAGVAPAGRSAPYAGVPVLLWGLKPAPGCCCGAGVAHASESAGEGGMPPAAAGVPAPRGEAGGEPAPSSRSVLIAPVEVPMLLLRALPAAGWRGLLLPAACWERSAITAGGAASREESVRVCYSLDECDRGMHTVQVSRAVGVRARARARGDGAHNAETSDRQGGAPHGVAAQQAARASEPGSARCRQALLLLGLPVANLSAAAS